MTPAKILNRARRIALPVLLLLLGGCASQPLHHQGLVLIDDGRVEEGLAMMQRAVLDHPGQLTYRVALLRARQEAVERLLADARDAEVAGRPELAATAYRRAQGIDPDSPRVREALRTVDQRDVIQEIAEQARVALRGGDLELASRLNANVLALNPLHDGANALRGEIERAHLRETASLPRMRSKLSHPVSLEFRDAQLKMVLDVLSRASGINFLLDKDIQGSSPVSIFVREVPIEDAIELLLVQSRLEKRLINENTVLIYPNTPQKTKEFQDLVIKTFYLTNGDVKQTQQMLKSILKADDVYIDERLNMLVMRDTPEVVRLAEKLVATQDLAEPEVMLEVEVLEVTRSKLTELGLKFPSQLAGPAGTLAGAQVLNGSSIAINSGLVLNLKKEDGDTNILASPRIRVRSRERAKVHIGDRVPVVTAVVTPLTGTPVTTDSIQYLEVGLKLEVEPTVHLDNDVAIRVSLEVSTFTRLPPTPNGTTPVQISTRNAATMLRLHDGETQVLMGLLRDDDTRTATKVPLLGDLPVIGRLFTNELSDNKKTEVVLLITPHVVRNVQRPEGSFGETWSGTDTSYRLSPPLARGKALALAALAQPGAAAGLGAAAAVGGGFKLSPSLGGAAEPARGSATAPASGAAMAALAPTRAASAAALAPVRYTWSGPDAVRVGEEFTLTLEADSEAALSGTSLQLRFDPSLLEVLAVEEGELMRAQGGRTSFREKLNPVGGKVAIGVLREGEAGVSGSGSVVALRLRALKPVAAAQVHLMNAVPTGVGGAVLPLKASGPFSLSIQP